MVLARPSLHWNLYHASQTPRFLCILRPSRQGRYFSIIHNLSIDNFLTLFISVSPELRRPPALAPDGQPVKPVQEPTFIQKYWMHLLGAFLLISQSLPSFTSFSLLIKRFPSIHRASSRGREKGRRGRGEVEEFIFVDLFSPRPRPLSLFLTNGMGSRQSSPFRSVITTQGSIYNC